MDLATLQRTAPAGETGTLWTIDPVHSTVGFSIKHMVVATVHGRFHRFRGTIRFDQDRPEDTSVEVEIDASSVDTGIAGRDDRLRSADFFDVEDNPTIEFRSTRVEPLHPLRRDRWVMVGDLTLSEVTRPVELTVERMGSTSSRQEDALHFTATATTSRKDFGIGCSLLFERGDLVIGDQVKIAINVQANRPES